MQWRRVVLAIIVSIIVLSILIWIGYKLAWTGFSTKNLWDWMQLLIIPAVLAGGAYLLNESARQREKKAEEQTRQQEIKRNKDITLNELRKNFLTDLAHSYSKVKKARRILDGNVIEDREANKRTISYSVYETQIKEIIDVELEFEFYQHRLKTIPDIFSSNTTKELLKLMGEIENNLNNKIIEEYQGLSPSTKPLNMAQLPKLNEFIKTNTFRPNFTDPFHNCIRLIQADILNI